MFGEAETVEDTNKANSKEQAKKKHRSLSDMPFGDATAFQAMTKEEFVNTLQTASAKDSLGGSSLRLSAASLTPRNFKTDGTVRTFADDVGYAHRSHSFSLPSFHFSLFSLFSPLLKQSLSCICLTEQKCSCSYRRKSRNDRRLFMSSFTQSNNTERICSY